MACDSGDVHCQVGQAFELGQRLGPAVAGQVEGEHAVTRSQERARSVKFHAAPPSPCTRTSGGPSPPTQ